MTGRRTRLGAGAVAVVLGLASCGATPDGTRSATAGLPDLEQSLTAAEWLLDPSDSSLDEAAGNPVTLAFADATAASGAAPCNTYRGRVVLDGDDGVRLDDIATTLMSCEPAVMAAEREFLAALAQVRSADVADRDRLVLTSDGVRLSFSAVDVRALLVGAWALTGVGTGDAVRSMLVGTEPIARFGVDQSLVVELGCNTLSTTWETDGQALRVEDPAQTAKRCEEPAGLMAQETAIAAALADAVTVEVTPATLSLQDDGGDIVLVARRS